MNKYLLKIAESLPYRKRVEVVILKDDKILLTKNKNQETGEEYFSFPGGGVESQTNEQACQNESLEEIGVRIKNIELTKVGSCTEEGGLSKKDGRHLKFRGSVTRWFVAEYDKVDKSKLGNDGDNVRYVLKTLPEAISLLKSKREISRYRVEVVEDLARRN